MTLHYGPHHPHAAYADIEREQNRDAEYYASLDAMLDCPTCGHRCHDPYECPDCGTVWGDDSEYDEEG